MKKNTQNAIPEMCKIIAALKAAILRVRMR